MPKRIRKEDGVSSPPDRNDQTGYPRQNLWIRENEYWLKEIGPEEDYKDIFAAFQENDWRGGSCGGCI